MVPDTEGFLTPVVEASCCVQCGRCSDVCPHYGYRQPSDRTVPPRALAAWHLDADIRGRSSSGGAFTALAGAIMEQGGAVIGAALDADWVCRHAMVEGADSLDCLRGSKYVQSGIPIAVFRAVADRLEGGRPTMFSGTPCQIAGLRNFLGREYRHLYCCDLVCHGVPSPEWLRRYVSAMQRREARLTKLSFRDKLRGWKRFGVRLEWGDGRTRHETLQQNVYMSAFLKSNCLREACYTCPFATTKRPGDVTLADYWKVKARYPEYDTDDRGTSLVLVNTSKGAAWLDQCRQTLFMGDADLAQAVSGNAVLSRPVERPRERDTFYRDMLDMSVSRLRHKYRLYPSPFWRKILGRCRRRLVRLMETHS